MAQNIDLSMPILKAAPVVPVIKVEELSAGPCKALLKAG